MAMGEINRINQMYYQKENKTMWNVSLKPTEDILHRLGDGKEQLLENVCTLEMCVHHGDPPPPI